MKNKLLISCLVLLTGMSFLFLQRLKKTIEPTATKDLSKRIVATADNIKIRYFNAKQALQYKLDSPQIIEYSNRYGQLFKKPQVVVYNKDGQVTWSGHSGVASLSRDNALLKLGESVKIIEAPNSPQPVFITGSEMRYHAHSRLLTSDKPVTIDNGVVRQVSRSFTLDTALRKLTVKKRVRATYKK